MAACRFDPGSPEGRVVGCRVQRVAIVDEEPLSAKDAVLRIGQVPGHLGDPRTVRVDGYSGDVDPAAVEVDGEEDEVSDESA